MKKAITLAAATALFAAGALSTAQAQVTVDGELTAAEVTAGNYVLLGKYTNFAGNRSFGDNGIMSLYAANNGNKVYFFLAGTVETNAGGGGNGFQLYMNVPGLTPGLTAGAFLPAGAAGTTFEKITRIKLDFAPNMALALRGVATTTGPQRYAIETLVSSSASAVSARTITTTAAPIIGNGTPLTLGATATTGAYARFAGARFAYKQTTDGKVLTNPGNTSPNTGASYGGVGSFGWEMEFDRAAMGLTVTNLASVLVFALQNNSNGGYASGEFIPQPANASSTAPVAFPAPLPSPNLGGADNGPVANDVDFGVIPGQQFTGIQLTPVGVLGTKAAAVAAALGVSLYPNPAAGQTTVAYRVADQAQPVSVVLTDLMGRTVRELANGLQTAGDKTISLNTADIATGTYLVRVKIGQTTATSKLVLL